MREAMDFDPSSTIFRSQEEVVEYLKKYHNSLKFDIMMEWCPPETNVSVSSPEEGMNFYPQVLVLRVHFSLTIFVHHVLAYYNMAPT